MSWLSEWRRRRSTAAPPPTESAAGIVTNARSLLADAAAAGRPVASTIVQPILDMDTALLAGVVPSATEQAFYAAYTALGQATADLSKRPRGKREYPFEDAVDDAELLLKHASETGAAVPPSVAIAILAARTALKSNALTDTIRGTFYAAYGDLSKLFGDVTAETIRNCSSKRTGRALRRDRIVALVITGLVAAVSVVTFVADSTVKKIAEDIGTANDLAAKLRVGLSPGDDSAAIDAGLASDPCGNVKVPSAGRARSIRAVSDVSQLQEFASTIRAVQSQSIKLNTLLRRVTFGRFEECNAFAITCSDDERKGVDATGIADRAPRLQINAAILNYPAEVLCRIMTFQDVRSFATNVKDNYSSVVGGVTAYALPIFYALLGAYAYRLRLFADTIRKRSYHPSFSDSARMITAIIAGAICGLFNPAQGLALSPLAVAFLVGYGVELFFKLLDTMINSFGAGSKPA